MKPVSVVVFGASGYSGAELVRLLSSHPSVVIKGLGAGRSAGLAMGDVFPHLAGLELPGLSAMEDIDLDGVDVLFCALPHGQTQETVRDCLDKYENLRVIDLSADFRLSDLGQYQKYYGVEHKAPAWQERAVYGLSEFYREQIKGARLVANPGCYPTGALLPILPLIQKDLIERESIIIDSKSGTSGAGRGEKRDLLHSELSESVKAYAVGTHRHGPEIDQNIKNFAENFAGNFVGKGEEVRSIFTPHLVPMNRGILSTIYVKFFEGSADFNGIRDCLQARYSDEEFVGLVDVAPSTADVRGGNETRIAVFENQRGNGAVLVSALDNLVKGAAGQAVQNMNIMFGLDEGASLRQRAIFP